MTNTRNVGSPRAAARPVHLSTLRRRRPWPWGACVASRGRIWPGAATGRPRRRTGPFILPPTQKSDRPSGNDPAPRSPHSDQGKLVFRNSAMFAKLMEFVSAKRRHVAQRVRLQDGEELAKCAIEGGHQQQDGPNQVEPRREAFPWRKSGRQICRRKTEKSWRQRPSSRTSTRLASRRSAASSTCSRRSRRPTRPRRSTARTS